MIARFLKPLRDLLPARARENGAARTLADLRPGQRARILGYAAANPIVQRLMHLGLLTGEEVVLTRRALTGDPIEIRLLDYSLSLRQSEAAVLWVERLE